jgi:murein DD-endopeptidase MepM/ murein hydrolase activator NlpD
MISSETLKKSLGRRLTVMLIPHSDSRPIRLNFSVAFLILLATGWTSLTVWSGFIASRHVDYWRTKTNESVLRAKMWYFTQEMNQSREYLDRVKETEIALQNLLQMKSRKAIVESDKAMGGPTAMDRAALINMLAGRRPSLRVEDMQAQLAVVKQSGSDVMNNFSEISTYIKDQRDLFRATPRGWPTTGRITSGYGQRRDPFEQAEGEFHHGLDIANALGTPVKATADGIVQLASWQGGYGRLIMIEHGRGFKTYYGHNSKLMVKPGDRVTRGQVISLMGTSGHSTGYHLHYEIWQNGHVVNPMKFVKVEED